MERKIRQHCGALLIVLLGLNGCSVMPSPAPQTSAAAEAERGRAALSQWTLKARLTTPDQRASLRWRQSEQNFDLLLRGPFGFGGVRIVGSPDQVTIDDGDDLEVSDNPGLDIYQRTGMVVPLAALGWWVRGLPAPHEPAQLERDVAGHIRVIRQSAWVIQLADYETVDGLSMPQSVRMEHLPWFLQLDVSSWAF